MEQKITFTRSIQLIIKHFASLLYQDFFTIDSFKMLDDDIEVLYRVNGKRKTTLANRVSQIATNKKLLACFSRTDACEIGMFYGRIMERKLTKNQINSQQVDRNF